MCEGDADGVEELVYACHEEQLVVKRSRFVAACGPAPTEADALAFVAAVRDPAASHSCWAFRVDARTARRSDDGEPSGTAGAPILSAIDRSGLSDAVVVVVRHFGGVKLGTGGLARAYGGAAAAALAAAPRRHRPRTVDLAVGGVGHARVGAVLGALRAAAGVRVLDVQYDAAGATVRARVPARAREPLEAALQDATRGEAVCREAGADEAG